MTHLAAFKFFRKTLCLSVFFGGIVFLSACSSSLTKIPSPAPVPPTTKKIALPKIGIAVTAKAGESLFLEQIERDINGIYLENNLYSLTKHNGSDRRVIVHSGFLHYSQSNLAGKFYSASTKVTFGDKHYKGGVFVYNDGRTSIFIEKNGAVFLIPQQKINYIPDNQKQFSNTDLNRQLVYTGKSGEIISIVYRESKIGENSPVFSQNLSFDLSKSNIISYKSASFEILDSDNTHIKYKVLDYLQ